MTGEKNWFKKHPIWTGIMGIVIFFIIIGIFSGGFQETGETTKSILQENNTLFVSVESETLNTEKQEENDNEEISEPTTPEETDNEEISEPVTPEETDNEEISEPTTPEETEKQEDYFLVTRVIDGDTIEIEGGERIRLICINTPETGEEGYKEAKDFLRDLILYEEVELVKDVTERDKYNRLLRYIYLQDGTFVNEQLVRLGLGVAYPYGQDTRFCPIIEAAERMAEEDSLGIWEIEEEEPEEPDTDYVCSTNVYNCDDFSSCSEVMDVFNFCSGDIHRLDGDNDGIPCESLCG